MHEEHAAVLTDDPGRKYESDTSSDGDDEDEDEEWVTADGRLAPRGHFDEWNCVANALAPGVAFSVGRWTVRRGRRCFCDDCALKRARGATRGWLLVAARLAVPPAVAFIAAGFGDAVYQCDRSVSSHPLLLPNRRAPPQPRPQGTDPEHG